MSISKLVISFSILFSLTAFGRGELPALAGETDGKIWSSIPFLKGGNLHEFQAELSKTREEARGQLLNELGGLLIPLAMSAGDVAGLAAVLANIIKDFDKLVREHEKAAHENIPRSLQELLKAHYDELFDNHRLPPELEKGRFYEASNGAEELVKQVRFIAYGSYSVMAGGRVKATLTLEELISGKTKTFLAQGSVASAAAGLAKKLFDFFQSNQYPSWINPQEQLKWMAPLSPNRPVLATVARRYCQGQGARLPYAEELLQAALGGNYREGGIELLPKSFYAVADQQRRLDQYYYSTFPWADTQLGGPVQTSAGQGTILSRVWCVKGAPSKNIRLVESIYRLLRESKKAKVIQALEFILVQLQDFGMITWKSGGNFHSMNEAIDALHKEGVVLEVPTY